MTPTSGSTTALQTTPINEMLSFYILFEILCLSISRFETRTRILFSKSQSSRRERDLFSQHLRVRDESEIFISTSQGSRRERDIFFQSLMFRDGNEICKLISRGRARKNEPNSHENSRDREFSLCSDFRYRVFHLFWPDVPVTVLDIHVGQYCFKPHNICHSTLCTILHTLILLFKKYAL